MCNGLCNQFLPKIYSVTHQYLKKFSYGFWDNQWFGRNQNMSQIDLQFMPGIKNLNFIIFIFAT
jgi:hypothetical protein